MLKSSKFKILIGINVEAGCDLMEKMNLANSPCPKVFR